MASLADLNLPSNIVYDERTKRYHDMLQNYRMVSGARVAAMGTPQRADRSDQYATRQDLLNLRADLFRFVSHTTELTREALQALFEMQRAQLRDTERLRDYELDERESSAEGRSTLLGRLVRGSGRLAAGAMERVGSTVRSNPGLSLMSILGASILGFAAIPNESVERFGNTVDEIISTISSITDILGQIAAAAGLIAAAELARRALRRSGNRSAPTPQNRPSGGSPQNRSSVPGAMPRSPTSSPRQAPISSRPTTAPVTPISGSPSRMPRLPAQLQTLVAGVQIAQANRDLAQGNITREQYREQVGRIMGGVLGGALGGAALGFVTGGPIGAVIGGIAGGIAGNAAGGAAARATNEPAPTREQREQRLRERAANTAPNSPERRNLERTEASNLLTQAIRDQRLTNQQAVALSQEMRPGGIYHNRAGEVATALREGGNLEISPSVARRVNLPPEMIQGPGGRPGITVMPPVTIPAQQQPTQPAGRQQSQTPVAGLQIRNPEDAMLEALRQHMLPS